MKERDFEKIMEKWADRETQSAPEMHPTLDMYRMVRERRKTKRRSFLYPRWVTVGAAVACLAVVAALYTAVLRPRFARELLEDRGTTAVGLREGFGVEGGGEEELRLGTQGKGPPKGSKRGTGSFRRLELRVHRQGAQAVESVDLRAPHREAITLTSADNYRLLLEPDTDRYVYVFQLTSSDILVRLLPNEAYSPVQNPLGGGHLYEVPSEPNWLYAGGAKGKGRLYVLSSARPIQDVEDLYGRYDLAEDERNREEALSGLLKAFEAVAESRRGGMDGWVLAFDQQ